MPNWIGVPELLIILAIILLLFGAKRLPEIAKSLGQSIRTFKKAVNDGLEGDDDKKQSSGSSKIEGGRKGDEVPNEKK